MRVKLLTTMAGPQGFYPAGAVVDLPDEQARELVAGGYAVPVKTVTIETATLPPTENTAKRKARKEADDD